MGTDSEVLFHALYILLMRADSVVIWGVTIASFLAGYTLARIVALVRERWEYNKRCSQEIRERLLASIERNPRGEGEEEGTERP